MICPVCRLNNPPHARLCTACATSLANRCDRCGFENPAGFRFCGNCGFRIGETPTTGHLGQSQSNEGFTSHLRDMMPEAFAEKIAAERGREGSGRREVTVLFLDLQGFTTFSESHDPESVFARIDHCRRAFVEVIYAYEGSVDKFTGDGLMALFGVPVAHENDPERAFRAALAIQQRLQAINEAWGDEGLEMRVGINTGQVVAGRIGPDLRMEYTVLGDTVNVAQRLETLAEPGTIVVSESSYTRVASLFHAMDLGTVHVKGRQEAVRCYQLERLRPTATTNRLTGNALPFVGRERELKMLHRVAEQTRSGGGQVVLITGEAGIGKSRLLYAWQSSLNPHIYRIVVGASLSYRQPISYWPFITILETLFGIEEADSGATRWAKLERLLREKVPEIIPGELLPYLAHMLGVPIPDTVLAAQLQQQAPPNCANKRSSPCAFCLQACRFSNPSFWCWRRSTSPTAPPLICSCS